MKFGGYVLAFILVAGSAGLGLWARTQVPPSSESALPAAVDPTRDAEAGPVADPVSEGASGKAEDIGHTISEEGEEAGLQREGGLQPEASRPPQGSRQSYRRRRPSRYPGPIPTPEEWEPPEGPVRIGLQAGHWKASEAPAELSGIRDNGTRWGNKLEWEANLAIAQKAKALLEELGYEVDLLPAVVPPSYRAHLFISIHSDGSADPRTSGFRVAVPRRDPTGRASGFAELLQESYGEETGLPRIPTVTHRMQNYYAFNFRRYEHALHPMTIGVIIETGFLTSARDRQVIVDDPERAARGIVDAVKAFKETPPPATHPAG